MLYTHIRMSSISDSIPSRLSFFMMHLSFNFFFYYTMFHSCIAFVHFYLLIKTTLILIVSYCFFELDVI